MAILFILVLILVAHFSEASRPGVVTSTVVQPQQKVNPDPSEQFALTTSLISRRFCAGDEEVAVMQAKLKLQYHNQGSQPVILSKRSVSISALIISSTTADASAGKHEQTVDLHKVADEARIATQNYDAELVVILAGESYYAETMVPVTFSLTSQRVAGAVAPGQHVLQVRINTFPTGGRLREYAEQLARQKGYVWRNYVLSAPMTFEIESTPKLDSCD